MAVKVIGNDTACPPQFKLTVFEPPISGSNDQGQWVSWTKMK
jgi:hypothetical protein